MTFVEILLLILAGLLICFALRPVQRRLEKRFYRFFRSKTRGGGGTVIDVTPFRKSNGKTEKKDEH